LVHVYATAPRIQGFFLIVAPVEIEVISGSLLCLYLDFLSAFLIQMDAIDRGRHLEGVFDGGIDLLLFEIAVNGLVVRGTWPLPYLPGKGVPDQVLRLSDLCQLPPIEDVSQ